MLITFALIFLVEIIGVNSIFVEDTRSENLVMREVAEDYDVVTTGVEQPKMNGYIVQFKDEPMLPYVAELERDIREQQETIAGYSMLYAYTLGLPKRVALMYNVVRRDDRIANHKDKILSVHDSFKQKLGRFPLTGNAAGTGDTQILAEYTDVFNGIALDVSEDRIISIREIPEVKGVYPNYEVHALLMGSIPLINADDVWLLDEDGNNCAETGKECLTGKGVKVAVIDTGVDYTHPDLGRCFGPGCKVMGGYDFVNDDNDPMDDNGHGTHVAGIAAGKGDYNNNNIWDFDYENCLLPEEERPPNVDCEIWGVAPDASLLAYKVLDSRGDGWDSDIIAGIERAVSDGADVISMSLGGLGYSDDPMSQAVDNAVDDGVVVVVAAGNSGPSGRPNCMSGGNGNSYSICSPGTAKKGITVGATDDNDYVAGFSSRGPTVLGLIKPDIVAPGVDICAAQWDDAWSYSQCVDDEHTSISGTSMSTPHVAGAIALIKQKKPDWKPEEIKYSLKITSKKTKYNIVQGQDFFSDILYPYPAPSKEICTKLYLEDINFADLYLLMDKDFHDLINNAILRYDNNDLPGEKIKEKNWELLIEGYYYNRINQYHTTFDDITVFEGEYWLCSDFTEVIEARISYYSRGSTNRYEDVYMDTEGNWHEPIGYSDEISDLEIGLLLVYSKESTKYMQGEGRIDVLRAINMQNPPPIANFKLLNSFFDKNERLSIEGTAFSESLNRYTLELISKINPLESYVLKIGDEPVFNDIIAENIDISSFDGEWILKLEVTDTYGQSSIFEQEILITDPLLQNGWPQYMIGEEISGSFLNPVIGDLDNDGDLEIVSIFRPIVAFVDPKNIKYQAIYAWHHDGSLVRGFPLGIMNESIDQGGYVSNPTLGDLDNDGDLEILVGTKEGIYAFNHTGGLVSGWPVMTELHFDSDVYSYGPILADLNNDGYLEVISSLYSRRSRPNYIYVFDKNGNTLLEKEIDIYPLKISIANLDDDEDLEIVVLLGTFRVDKQEKIIIYDYNGDVVVSKDIDVYPFDLSLGDVDNDGIIEIVFKVNKYIVIMNGDGEIEQKWDTEGEGSIGNDLALGDLDNNGDLEIASHDWGRVWIWNHDGTKFNSNYPVRIPPQFSRIYDLGIGDIDNDGYSEIFGRMENHERTTSPSSYTHSIGAWNGDGSVVDNFPLNLYNLRISELQWFSPVKEVPFSPTIDDIDRDGDIEFVVTNGMGRMYVLDIPADYNQDKMDWPTYRHDYRHTGLYTKKGVNENCERMGDEDGNGLADCLDPACPEGIYCNLEHTKTCKNRVCVPISEGVEITCETLGFEQCQVNSICECFVTNCNSGWVRAKLPDNSKAVEYFSSDGFTMNAGTAGGEAEAFISCRDDGKEYETSVDISSGTSGSTTTTTQHQSSIVGTFIKPLQRLFNR